MPDNIDLIEFISARLKARGVTRAAEAEASIIRAMMFDLDGGCLSDRLPEDEAGRLKQWLRQRHEELNALHEENRPLCKLDVTMAVLQLLQRQSEGQPDA